MPARAKSSLPAPTAEAAAHSRRLRALIERRIVQAGGAIPFDEYMRVVLYESGLGYYMAGSSKLGPGGDFITAPEISPLLAQGLAAQCAAALEALDGGGLIEFGAGSGGLAVDLVRALEARRCLPDFYAIVEPSAELRERQVRAIADRLGSLPVRVEWWSSLPAQPVQGIIVCNEVLDAMPVKRFRTTGAGMQELCVTARAGCFEWCSVEPSPELRAAWEALRGALSAELPEGYESEINVQARAWLAALAALLERGMILCCDYGYPRHEYYHPQRDRGTLICHYRHRAHDDPFWWPGLQDISAFVDFTAWADAAVELGFEVAGYTSQAAFLAATALPSASAAAPTTLAELRAVNAAKTLLLPGEMGEKFKLLALRRDCACALPAFDLHDQRHRLCAPI
jgi:SAM-dependent MidA family methyltransferase